MFTAARTRPLNALLAGDAVAADLLSRTVAQSTEVPLGILTAVTGAPFFLWLLRRQGGAK